MLQEYLNQLVETHKEDYKQGHVATYIPELAQVNPAYTGIAFVFKDGRVVTAGDATVEFAIESISKTVVLALALLDQGEEGVFKHMSKEPSGDAFNSIVKLQTTSAHVPFNPYINAGAILTTSLIKGATPDEKFDRILAFMKKISETDTLTLNTPTYLSEKATGDTNRSLAWMMKSYGDMEGDVEDILDVYFRQCSINVTAVALAKIGAFFARGGVLTNGERILTPRQARIITGLMATCGCYDGSGTQMVDVGIPTKSGVGGGLLCAHPTIGGIATFGPALDEKGNSVVGIRMLMDVSKELGLDVFEPNIQYDRLK